MMNFFRKHAATIVIVILVVFVGTMFTGMAFMGIDYFDKKDNAASADMSQQMAVMGTVPVNQIKFVEAQQQVLAQVKGQPISPEIAEAILYTAFVKAMRYSILSQGAKEAKLKLSSDELAIGLQNLYIQFDIKDKAALKKELKKNNYPYKDFIATLKEELLSEKFAAQLAGKETVTDRDLQNAFTTILAQHILIKVRPEDANYASNKITQIQADINSGKISFEDAAKAYSEDEAIKDKNGVLGWIKIGDTYRSFEEALFLLNENQISEPVKTPFGLHLIKAVSKKIDPLPTDEAKVEELRKQLLAQKQTRAVDEYLQGFLVENPLTIFNPVLRAYQTKNEGKFEDSIQAYQEQISLAPELPSPHYLLGQIYQALGDSEKAEEQWKNATIKAGMNPQLDFPNLHLALGGLYKQQGRLEEMTKSFEKAIPSAQNDVLLLEQVKQRFERMNEPAWAAQASKKLALLKIEAPAATQEAATQAAPASTKP